MMGYAIDPGAQRTAGIEAAEASPQLKVNLLEQVAALFRMSFVGAGEAFEGGRELFRGIAVLVVLGRDGLDSCHIQGSRRWRSFLTLSGEIIFH